MKYSETVKQIEECLSGTNILLLEIRGDTVVVEEAIAKGEHSLPPGKYHTFSLEVAVPILA